MMLLIQGCLTGCAETPTCRIAAGMADTRQGDAGCLIVADASLLVIRHRLGGKLGLPGGAAAAGESAQCTAHRETWEETGLNVRIGRFLGRLDTGFLVYRCEPDPGLAPDRQPEVPVAAQTEVTEMIWVEPADLHAEDWRYADQLPEIRRMLQRPQRR